MKRVLCHKRRPVATDSCIMSRSVRLWQAYPSRNDRCGEPPFPNARSLMICSERLVGGGLTVVACLVVLPTAAAGMLRHGDRPAELSVSAVSDRTVRIVLAPLDESGKAGLGPASTVLANLKTEPKLHVRELTQAREIESGKLRVRITPDPLTITIRGPGEAIVQELVVTEADGSMTFRTDAPVLGL